MKFRILPEVRFERHKRERYRLHSGSLFHISSDLCFQCEFTHLDDVVEEDGANGCGY